jgi:hypothetical protein
MEIGKSRIKPIMACRALFLAACLWGALNGHHPPAIAQSTSAPADVYGIQVAQGIQQANLMNMVRRQDEQDKQIAALTAATEANANAQAGSQGETRGLIGGLGILQVIIAVIAYRKKGTA